MTQMKILVTGASGFVGTALTRLLGEKGLIARCTSRSDFMVPQCHEKIIMPRLDEHTDWSIALKDCRQVIHLAARVHVMQDTETDPLTAFRKVNLEVTTNLARQAASMGVERFIFLSSIKVNGEETGDKPFSEDDIPRPKDPYAVSKLEAELALAEIAQETGMEVVIIRCPIVYGPGVKANFLSMIRCIGRGIPLPLGAISNKRSLVGIDNLVDLVVTCLSHPKAGNQTFLVSDGEDVSTSDLLRRIAMAIGTPARLLRLPPKLIKFLLHVIGRKDYAKRLLSSLQVDISKAKRLLDWSPALSLDEGLIRTVKNVKV